MESDNNSSYQEKEILLQDLTQAAPSSSNKVAPEAEITLNDKHQETSSPLPESDPNAAAADKSELKSVGKWRKIVCIASFCIAEIMVNLDYSLISPFFPEQAKKKGASPIITGAIISCAPLLVAILSPVFGILINLIGVRVMIGVGLMQVGITCLLMGFIVYIPISWAFIVAAFLLRIIEGIGTAMYITAAFSVVPNLFPGSVGTIIGLFDLVGGIGFVLGAPFGSILYQAGGYKLPFIVTGILMLTIVIPCVIFVGRASVKKERKMIPFKIVLRILTNVFFMLLALTLVLAMGSVGFLFPTLEPYMIKHFHYSPSIVGLTILILALAYFLSSVPFGIISDKLGYRRVFITVGLILIHIGYFLISIPYFTGEPYFAYIVVGFVIIGIGGGCSIVPIYPEMLKTTERYITAEHDRDVITPFISGITSTALSLGEFFGSMLGGALDSMMSFPLTAFLFASCILAQAIVVMATALIDHFV